MGSDPRKQPLQWRAMIRRLAERMLQRAGDDRSDLPTVIETTRQVLNLIEAEQNDRDHGSAKQAPP